MPDLMQQISDMICDAMVLDLKDTFKEVEGAEDAGVIKAGKLQDDPTKLRVAIMVHIGDPENPAEWIDGHAAYGVHPLREMEVRPTEVGGGEWWWRRGTVEFQYFGLKDKFDRDETRRIANVIKGRIEHTIDTSVRIPGLADSFGETVMDILPVSDKMIEGGGPPKSFIWRGLIRWQARTYRNV